MTHQEKIHLQTESGVFKSFQSLFYKSQLYSYHQLLLEKSSSRKLSELPRLLSMTWTHSSLPEIFLVYYALLPLGFF